MAHWSGIRTYVPECRASCDLAQSTVQNVDHHFLAASIYLMIIVLARVTVLESDYFYRLFYKLRRRGMDKAAAKNVYHFTLAIFLTNGILHAVKLTDAHFLIATPLQAISRITVFQILYLIDNALLWLGAIKLYNQDVDSERDIGASFEERKARVIAYFGPVCLLFIFEDGFSLYWEHFETNNVLGYLLNEFQAWNGLSIIVALILLAVMIVAAIVVAISRRDWFVGIVWVALLRALRFYLPIAGLLLVGIPVLTFSVSGGNEDIAPSAPSKNSIPVQSATPAQSAAPAEGAIPPARSIAPIQSAAPARTPAKGDYEQAVADHTQPIEVGPKSKVDYNTRGLANNARGEYDRAIADFQ